MRAASTASSQQELTSAEQSDNREFVKAARGSYRTLAAVPLAATLVATITAVEIARMAAREEVGQAKSRRRSRTPANSSAVPVAVAIVRLGGARQCNNRGCNDQNCGSQCDTHNSRPLGSRPLALHVQYSGISPRQASPRHHGARRLFRWPILAVAVRRARDFRFAED